MKMRNLVEQTRNMATGSVVDRLNVLSQPWLEFDDRLSFKYPVKNAFDGMVISAGLMTWQVIGQPDESGLSVPILPNPMGNGSVRPVPAGSIARLAPRYTDAQVFSLLNNEIAAMSSPANGLFDAYSWSERVKTYDSTYYVPDDAADMYSVIDVTLQRTGFTGNFTIRDYTYQGGPQGGMIRLWQTYTDGEITFRVRRPFRKAAYLDDDPTSVCSLQESMLDIPVLGAAGMLLLADEGRRNNIAAQGEPRRREDTPASSLAAQGRELLRQRDRRIMAEAGSLAARFSVKATNLAYGSGWSVGGVMP